jgi:hypothetical protein
LDLELARGVQPAQLLLVDLADARLRQLGHERPVLGQPELRDSRTQKLTQGAGVGASAWSRNDHGERAFFPARVGHADHSGFEHRFVRRELVLEIDR